jgi:hypothetical protein
LNNTAFKIQASFRQICPLECRPNLNKFGLHNVSFIQRNSALPMCALFVQKWPSKWRPCLNKFRLANTGLIQTNFAFVMSALFEGKCYFWNEQVLRNEGFIQMN